MRTPRLLVLDENEDLSKQLEQVASELRPRPEVVWCDGFEAVDELIAETGPFDVVVAGPLASKDSGFQQLRRMRARAPGMKLVLAVDRWRSGSLRDTVRTGALDILRMPVDDEELLDAVEQALQMETAPAVVPVDDRETGDGTKAVIAVVSASGGCGKTFFATSLAYYLQSRLGKRTCLVDLDLQFGELSTALRLKPKYTISDLVSRDDSDEEDLGKRFEEHLERHESGIHLLAGPDEPADADEIDASRVSQVIEAARSRFDYVIIDTPAALSEAVLVALEQADQIFALATLDLPSVRNLTVMLSTLKKLKVPSERVKLLLNKVEPDVGIDVERVERYFPQGFAMTIPYGRDVNRSLNMGQPVMAYAPRGEVSRALESGLDTAFVPTTGQEAGADDLSRRRRRLGLRARKSA